MLHSGLDRTTTAVTEDDDEGHIQFGDGVFNAALDRRTAAPDDVAGDPHNKDVATPTSNRISGATRESAQLTITAWGY